MLKMLKPVKKLNLFLTDVRRIVTTSVICVQKIQTYTLFYAEFIKEVFGQNSLRKRLYFIFIFDACNIANLTSK